MSRAGVDPDIAEPVSCPHDRRHSYPEKKKAALAALGAQIERIVKSAG
jgi:hypothetical protein